MYEMEIELQNLNANTRRVRLMPSVWCVQVNGTYEMEIELQNLNANTRRVRLMPSVWCVQVNGTYEMEIELQNLNANTRRVRLMPPSTKYFSVADLVFPTEGGSSHGQVAPGMKCKVRSHLTPI
jgi:hypothetical protein